MRTYFSVNLKIFSRAHPYCAWLQSLIYAAIIIYLKHMGWKYMVSYVQYLSHALTRKINETLEKKFFHWWEAERSQYWLTHLCYEPPVWKGYVIFSICCRIYCLITWSKDYAILREKVSLHKFIPIGLLQIEMFFICQKTSDDYVIERSCDFIRESS